MRRVGLTMYVFCMIAFFTVTLPVFSQPLTGTKTIGGTEPDYASISAAIQALNTQGAGGNVTFLIRGGTYNESPDSLLASATTGPNARVVFKPSDTLGITINITCTASATTAFNFINAPYITFDGSHPDLPGRNLITVNSLTSNGYNSFRFCNGASHIVIKNINMSVSGALTNNQTRPIWQYLTTNYTPQASADSDSIMFCRISGGYYGMFLSGLNSPAISASNWYIHGNKIVDFGMYGIYISAMNYYFQIDSNEVYRTTPGTSGSSYGIAHTNALSTNNSFTRNYIHDLNCISNTTIYGFFIQSGSGLLFANNMINLTGPSGNIYGMDLLPPGCKVFYNTIQLSGVTSGNSSSFGIFISGNSTDSVANNIIINDRTGGNTATYHAALFFSATPPVAYCDYNLLAAGNDSVGDNRYVVRYLLNNYNTLNDVRQVGTYIWDTHSISFYPTFVSATDLHLSTAVRQSAESAGTPIWNVTTDYDNDTRSTIAPDIGCDEGNFLSGGDLFPPVLRFTPLGTISTASPRSFSAVILDNIGIAGGANSPRVYYKLSNDVNWSFNTPDSFRADTLFYFTIPSYPLGSIVDYYLAAQDTSSNVTSYPAGATGTNPPGTTPPPTPATYFIQTLLSGIKTIGGTNPDFPSISTAINALNTIGTATGVTFQIRGGTYNENPDSILATAGTGPNARVVFQPADTNGVIINISCTASASTAFNFINAPYITFDGSNPGLPGRNLIAVNALTTNGNNCFRFCNGASHIVLKNLDMTVGTPVTSTNSRPIWQYLTTNYTPQANADSDTIVYCQITGGYYGMFLSGLNSPPISANYWYVAHNNIHDFGNYGIDISAEDYNCVIEANEIYLTSPNTSGVCYGIAHTNGLSTNNTIIRNWIHDLSSGTFGTTYGIQLSAGYGLVVANNMVSINGAGGYVYGIFQGTPTDTKLFYNTVVLSGNGQFTAAALYMNGQSSDSLADNIFINDRSGATAPTYYDVAMYIPSTSAFAFSDHNLITALNDSVGDNGYAVFYNGVPYNTLSDLLQNTAYAWDANSITVEPTFVSSSDLHLNNTASQPPESAGIPVAGITNDIDNQTRNSSTPDIGCDEGNFQRLAYGTISGTVRDSTSQLPIVNAEVSTGHNAATTDSSGHYSMDVRTGTYDLTVTDSCFATTTHPGVQVDSNVTITVNFDMLKPLMFTNISSIELLATPGQILSNSVTITNSGNADLHWQGVATGSPHGFDKVKHSGRATGKSPVRIIVTQSAKRNLSSSTKLKSPEALYANLHQSTSSLKNRIQSINQLDTTGGPDSSGYRFVDSNSPGGPVYNWIDISSNYDGAVLSSMDDDYAQINLGSFVFPFYGINYSGTSVNVCSNGWLEMGGGTGTAYSNSNLPATNGTEFNQLTIPAICALWDDWIQYARGVTYKNFNDSIFVVDWYGEHFNVPSDSMEVEAVLYPNGNILFQYRQLTGGSSIISATVGIQGSTTGNNWLQYGDSTFVPTNGTAILFYNTPPWLTMSPTAGTVAPGQANEISIQAIIDSAVTVPANWSGFITLTSDACNPRDITIPVTITIDTITTVTHDIALPYQYKLYQNYPNPFNPVTEIRFDLKEAGQTKLTIYNIQGRQVVELLSQKLSAGFHSLRFDASKLSTGVYFYRIESGSFTDVKKMVLVK